MLVRILDLDFSVFQLSTLLQLTPTTPRTRRVIIRSLSHACLSFRGCEYWIFFSLSPALFSINLIPSLSRHIHPVSGTITCSMFLIFIISIAYILIYARLHSLFLPADAGVKTDDILGLYLCHTAFIDWTYTALVRCFRRRCIHLSFRYPHAAQLITF